MEKRNTLLLTVIAVATLLVAVVGATFAYFASTVTLDEADVDFTANTAPMSSAFVATGSAFTLDVPANTMQSAIAGENSVGGRSTEGQVVIEYASSVEGTPMYCTYDVYWDWTGTAENAYLAHSPLSTTDPTKYAGKEFTIKADFSSSVAVADGQNALTLNKLSDEIDWTDVTITTDKVLVGQATIWSNSLTKTIHTWKYNSVFYNVQAYQNDLAGRTYTGVFTVENVVC